MNNRIVILSRLPPLEVFSKILGIDIFQNRGFEVIFLDLSALIDGQIGPRIYDGILRLRTCRIESLTKIKELDLFLKSQPENTIYIDMCVGDSKYGIKFERFMRVLKKNRVKFYVVKDGKIPSSFSDSTSVAIWRKIIKLAKNPSMVPDALVRRIIAALIKINYLYPRPYRVFDVTGSGSILEFGVDINEKSTRVIPINSRDFDNCQEYLVLGERTPERIGQTCVFLDEDMTNHPDFFLTGQQEPLEPSEYFSSLNLLFSQIECDTGMTVIIAAHPKSRFRTDDHRFEGRSFIKGKTVELVADSQMVIAHSSSSIGIAVCFQKPIMLVVTNEMTKRKETVNLVNAFAKELSLKVNHISALNTTVEINSTLNMSLDYENYLYKFLRSKGATLVNRWQIVANYAIEDLTHI